MPQLGDIQKGNGTGKNPSHKYIWVACAKCGKERWITISSYKNSRYTGLCVRCIPQTQRGINSHYWKGGHILTGEGYMAIKLLPDDPYISMADTTRYVREHRLVMAKSLGRPLARNEQVHHKNGIKTDNRIENLELVSLANHRLKTRLCHDCELRKEVRMLRLELKQLREQLQVKLDIAEIPVGVAV